MVEATKFTEFTDTAKDKLNLIQSGLLRHEKNPVDREFINDIFRSVRSIKTASLPVGLGRVSELCFHLENMLDLIRRNRLPFETETIELLRAGKNRLDKLVHEIETAQQERATIKDLVKRIKKFEGSVADIETMEPAPALEVLQTEIGEDEDEPDLSLLPDEIKNQEYDEELFQIFIEQMQENLSLLRSLTNSYPDEGNQSKIIAICSESVGKLQTSANYMGYEKLADFYLQWIAELEMTGVDISIGSPVSFDFMELNIRQVAALFPQINDEPADPTLVARIKQEFVIQQPEKKPKKIEKRESRESFGDLFNDFDDDITSFDEEFEPIAALAGMKSLDDEDTETSALNEAPLPLRTKKSPTAPIEIDGSFLEEERQSQEFDEELFQIYIQQLQENLSQLRSLVNGYKEAVNKAKVIDICSKLVGKLRSSANYMGYERLAEYHLQWIAELELASIEVSLGNDLNIDFMNEKISKIAELFPQVEDVPVDSVEEYFSSLSDEEAFFGDTVERIASMSGIDEPSGHTDRGTDTAEAKTPTAEKTPEDELLDVQDPGETSGDPDSYPDGVTDDFLSGEFEEGVEESFEFDAEPIAALSEDGLSTEEQAEKLVEITQAPPPPEEIDESIDIFFQDESQLEQITPSEAAESEAEPETRIPDEELFSDFDIEEEFDVSTAPMETLTEDDSTPPAEGQHEDTTEIIKEEVQAPPADDIDALFGEPQEDEPEPHEEDAHDVAEVPPVRKKLLEKLSHALKSLDDEVADEAVTSLDDEEDLYEKLAYALEESAAGAQNTDRLIDNVLGEILDGQEQPGPISSGPDTTLSEFSTESIRQNLGLDAGKIDTLVSKIGELVASRSSLSQLHTDMNSLHHRLLEKDGLSLEKLEPLKELISRLGSADNALGRVSNEIKDGILNVRMTPIGHLFDLFREFVPVSARESGKEIHLNTQGDETEIDHCYIEDIADCLLVMISNAVEHGIAPPSERVRSGKEEAGAVSINAFQKGNYTILEVSDDGQGIDPKKIKAAALAGDIFSGDELYRMSDNELTRLIMSPGFSTGADDHDKRGPGMDKVKQIIENFHGKIQIRSTVGSGTTVRLSIPVNLPNFQALQFSDGADSYAVPLTCVEEVIRSSPSDLVQTDGASCIPYRGEDVPVISLSDLLDNTEHLERSERFFVVIIFSDTRKVGLMVNTVLGLEDVSIKPLSQFLREQSGFSGAAVRGEGEMLFIPDITRIIDTINEKHPDQQEHVHD